MNLYCLLWLDSLISLLCCIHVSFCFHLPDSSWNLFTGFDVCYPAELTYKSADLWPRVSTDKHTCVVSLALLPDIKQVLDPGYHNNSLWLIDPTRLHVWAPTGQLSSQLQPKLCSRWSDIFLRQTPPICEQIVLYLKTTIFTFLIGQYPTRFIWCFYFVPELNPNTKVKIQHNS